MLALRPPELRYKSCPLEVTCSTKGCSKLKTSKAILAYKTRMPILRNSKSRCYTNLYSNIPASSSVGLDLKQRTLSSLFALLQELLGCQKIRSLVLKAGYVKLASSISLLAFAKATAFASCRVLFVLSLYSFLLKCFSSLSMRSAKLASSPHLHLACAVGRLLTSHQETLLISSAEAIEVLTLSQIESFMSMA